jgi:hypothetical protein
VRTPRRLTAAHAEKARIEMESTSRDNIAIFTSYAWIFLPKYSGVRPTIRPAMNTASTTKTSMP